MTFHVKPTIAKKGMKRRNRRVKKEKVVKTKKVDLKIEEDLKDRFTEACKTRGATQSAIARELIIAWCKGVEKGKRLNAPFDIREEPKQRTAS